MANNEGHIQERLPVLNRIKVAFDKYVNEIGEKPKFLRLGVREKEDLSMMVRGDNIGTYITDQNIDEMTIGDMSVSFSEERTAIDLGHKEGWFIPLRRTSYYYMNKANDAIENVKQLS